MYQMSEAEGRNGDEDFFIHHSTSEDPSQLQEEGEEGEGEQDEEEEGMHEEGGGN